MKGYTKIISIPGCVEFTLKTNACRGFCASWAVPSIPQLNSNLQVTSVGQCCNMMDTEEVSYRSAQELNKNQNLIKYFY